MLVFIIKKWNTLILYIRLNLKMLVYIGLFGNFQLKQQLKITFLQADPKAKANLKTEQHLPLNYVRLNNN